VSPYDFGNRFNHDPLRRRRLLMHKRQILKLEQQTREKGVTLIPLKLFFKRNKIKVDLSVARGKQLYDKRAAIKGRQDKREIERLVKGQM
jgi:SsrA-binding protein